MSSKRRRTDSFKPMDNLSNTNRVGLGRIRSGSGQMKRHTVHRDPSVVAKVNSDSVRGELMAPSANEELHVIDEVPRSDSGGLLADGDRSTHVSYTISGSVQSIDAQNETVEKSSCLLNFINDPTGPRINFKYREQVINQIDLQKDCRAVIFDKSDLCIVFLLREPRPIRIDTRRQIERSDEMSTSSHAVLWESTDSTKILRIHEILKQSKACDILVEPSAESLKKRLPEYLHNKSALLRIKSYGSLERGRQSTGEAHIIHVPSSPGKQDGVKKSTQIPVERFYKANSATGNASLSSHAFSNTRQTRSQGPNLIQSKLWNIDDENDHEVPEKFTPRLCYKFGDGAAYTITNQDFKCLYNHDWINDTILDFFTKYYVEKAIKDSIVTREKVYIMSSFFYTKLVSDPSDYYGNIQNWVTNCDLFNKQYVVVPINMNFHWFGCIITNLDSILQFFERLSDNEKAKLAKKPEMEAQLSPSPTDQEAGSGRDIISRLSSRSATPLNAEEDDDAISISAPIITILTFDSLRQTHSREIDPIKDFLIAYAKDKYNIDLDKSLIKMRTCAVPQQPNMSDCGVHVILNTMKFFENPVGAIEVWRTAKSRSKTSSRIINEYFEKNKRSAARRDLRDVLWALQRDQIKIMEQNNEKPLQGESSGVEEDEEDGDIEIIEDLSKFRTTSPHPGDASTNLEPERGNVEPTHLTSTVPQEKTQIIIESFNSKTNSEGSFRGSSEVPVQLQHLESEDASHNVDGLQVASPSLGEATNRKFLESSPVRASQANCEGTAQRITSPYFGSSSLKSRSDAFEANDVRPISSQILSSSGYRDGEGQMTQPPSSILSEFPVAENEEAENRRSSSFSDGDESRVTISDKIDDSDVNLVGYPEKDSLNRVIRDLDTELNNTELGDSLGQTFNRHQEPSGTPSARLSIRKPQLKNEEHTTTGIKSSRKSSTEFDRDIQSIPSDSD